MNEARETILLLGKLRAVEAIPLLIKNLEFANGGGSYIREEFSCLGALIDIGSPALAPLLTAAANTDDAALRRLISYAFINIVRRDAAVAYIKSQAPPNLSAAQREHLDALMQDISHLPDALTD